MTEDQLTLIATRIMDRVEKDGNGLQLTALVEELRAGLAIVEAQPVGHTHLVSFSGSNAVFGMTAVMETEGSNS